MIKETSPGRDRPVNLRLAVCFGQQLGDMGKLTDANRNTLKKHFRALVDAGHLTLHGKGLGVWYGLR